MSTVLLASGLLLLATPAAEERIVSLGGAVTETLYALGLGDRVVGVDQSSLYPEAARAKAQVGYYRQFSSEGVLSLAPTLVVGLEASGPPAALEQLRAAGLRVVLVPEVRSVEGALARIRRIAAAVARQRLGEDLAYGLEARVRHVTERLAAGKPERPRVLYLFARSAAGLSVAGRDTAADAIIRLAGGENVAGAMEGYKPFNAEALLEANPTHLVLSEFAAKSMGGEAELLARPGLRGTPAAQKGQIVLMDDLLLLGFGPRTGEAVEALARALHPEVFSASETP